MFVYYLIKIHKELYITWL